MSSGRQPHILSASSSLLGICFVIITGLKITGVSRHTLADETSLVAASGFSASCILSYASMRARRNADFYEYIADYLFFASLLLLFGAVLIFAANVA